MWIVANVNSNQFSLFQESLKKVNGDVTEIYFPKIVLKNNKYQKTKNLLGNYIFCFNNHFNLKKITTLKYLQGLNYFLENSILNQKEISSFIALCKSFEDKKGTLKSSFFANFSAKNFKFLNGPLKSIFFKILDTNKNKIFAEINGDKRIVIEKKNCIHFLSN
tara:strand:+ start:1843 stop:2331 length:489 start_codon:yes stop_codon:yes gene_type:complete